MPRPKKRLASRPGRGNATETDAEGYEKEFYLKVQEIVKPYLLTLIVIRPYAVETTLCEHFVEALAA